MPKYQMIFESTKILADDEFEEIIKPFITQYPEFEFKYAQNLEGVMKQYYEKKEQIIEEHIKNIDQELIKMVETFEGIDEEFFKI